MSQVTLEVHLGEDMRGFRLGDFLNSLDELVCYFLNNTQHDELELAAALILYANRLED